jgi:hypothetical protein
MQEFLAQYMNGTIPDGPGGYAYYLTRYPSLLYLLFGATPNINFAHPYHPFFQRLPLVLPYLLLVWACYGAALRFSRDKLVALLFCVVTASSPVLLCYTSDKFLDIGHPILFFMGFIALAVGVLQDRSWLSVAVWSASLMPLVRDNALPTTLVLVGAVAVYELSRARFAASVVALFVGCWPGVAYYLTKSAVTSIDSTRLSYNNIWQQNYGLFFGYLPVYIPWAFLLLGCCGLVALGWRSWSQRFIVSSLVASLFAQLAVYAIFEPGWMPWSRNYLMFFGQVVALACLGFLVYRATHRRLWVLILTLNVATNAYLNFFELTRNRLFHESIAIFHYDKLKTFMLSNPSVVPHGSTIHVSVPVVFPHLPFSSMQIPRDTGVMFNPIIFAGYIFDWRSLMSFRDFIERAPQDAKYLMFHWRVSRLLFNHGRSNAARPTGEELAGFRVLFEAVDPFSDGLTGMILLERIAASK